MGQETEQKGNVCLDTANPELDQGTKHLSTSHLIRRTAHSDLHEQTVVMWLQRTVSVCAPNIDCDRDIL